MNKTGESIAFTAFSIFIGLLIALAPVIVTGHWYHTSMAMGNLLVAEFIVRTLAVVIGLLVIYNGIKQCIRAEIANRTKNLQTGRSKHSTRELYVCRTVKS